MNPANYKTQSGLVQALNKSSNKPMTVSLAWWYKQAEWALINKWGWSEVDAAKFIVRYKPGGSPYRC